MATSWIIPMKSNNLKDLIDTIDGLGDHVKEKTLKRIKRRTPVDTGKARDSWSVEDDGIYSSDDAGKIMALENGHSDQAPAGMIKITTAEIPDIIEEYLRKNT